MRKQLFGLALCALTASCAPHGAQVHSASGPAVLSIRPAVAAERNELRLTGVETPARTVDATATMSDMPAISHVHFAKSGDALVATTSFSMAGTWRLRVPGTPVQTFTFTLK